MVRVGKEAEAAALSQPFAQPCLDAGRRMAGFIMVEPAGISESAPLSRWLELARAYVNRLPPKATSIDPIRHDTLPHGACDIGV